MSDEYQERASALLADLKSNRSDEGSYRDGERPTDPETGKPVALDKKGRPKKKRKGRLPLVLVVLILLGTGGYFGLVKTGRVKLSPPSKPSVIQVTPDETEEEPEVEATPERKTKPKDASQDATRSDPAKGARKIALVWETMEPEAVVKLAKGYKDDQLSRVLGKMDPEKAGAILALVEGARAAKLSRLIEEGASVIPAE